jgi:Flp pilus assembly protein TadB
VAVVAAACTAWLVAGPSRPARSAAVGSSAHRRRRSERLSLVEDDRARAAVCAAGCAVLGSAVLGGLVGAALGVVAGLLLGRVLGRLEPPSVARRRLRIEHDLPVALDLLAACAIAGLPVMTALPTVASAVGGPLGGRLDELHARWRLGGSAVDAWEQLATEPGLQRLGTAMARTHRSGAPLVPTLTRLALDVRRDRRSRMLEAARAVGVRAAGPMAACFLPAFMLIGVVPTVIGGFRHLGL